MHFTLGIYFLTSSLFAFCLSSPPEPISLHAPLLDQTEEGIPHPGQSLPPLKISTGRMKPITSTGSPRYQEAINNAGIGSSKHIKSVTHVGILPHHESEHLYPKVTVKPGRKDSTVVSVFVHTPSDFKGIKPYEYLQHQQKDSLADISQPAGFYKVGHRKQVDGSKDVDHAHKIVKIMGKGHYNPKAALISTIPGDIRAKRKRPTIEVDPGKYHGNLVTSICGPDSPPKRGCGAVPINFPVRSGSSGSSGAVPINHPLHIGSSGGAIQTQHPPGNPSSSSATATQSMPSVGAVPINNPTRSRSRSRSTSPDRGSEGKRRRIS